MAVQRRNSIAICDKFTRGSLWSGIIGYGSGIFFEETVPAQYSGIENNNRAQRESNPDSLNQYMQEALDHYASLPPCNFS